MNGTWRSGGRIEAIGSTGGSKYFSDEPIHVELDPTGSGAYFNASDEVIVTARNTAASVPPPVDGVQASNAVGTTALVSWVADPLSTGATGYRVYRSTTYAFTPGGANLVHTTTDPNEASFQDTGLTPGVIYYYRVEAFNNAGESDPSIQEDTETSLQAAPIAPGALAATRSGNQVTLTWENRSGSRTIRIERSTNSSFTSSTFFTANDDFATSWLDTGAGGATFFYRVVAIEDQYNRSEARLSDPSNVVSA